MAIAGDGYQYGTAFQRYAAEQAQSSAQAVVPLMIDVLKCRSVLDVGCGNGMWLRWYRANGVADILGIDGDYVEPQTLLIPPDRFKAVDICLPFHLDHRFDLVQCLEVAEHVPPDASRALIDNLTTHGRHVLFSAAVPGQGGEAELTETFYEAAREPKTMWQVPGSGHTGGIEARPAEYEQRVIRFFDEALLRR